MTEKEKEQLLERLRIATESQATDKIVITRKPSNCPKPKGDTQIADRQRGGGNRLSQVLFYHKSIHLSTRTNIQRSVL